MSYLFFDLILAALLLVFLWRGYARGLVLTLCGLLAVFVALIGATLVSDALAQPVADAIQPVVERGLRDSVESYYQYAPPVAESGSAGEDGFWEGLPLEEVLEALRDSPLYRGFVEAFQSTVGQEVAEATSHAVRAVADYIAVQIARMVLFLLAFVAILVVWFLLSHALDLVARLPVLNGLNRWGGAAAGLIKGALVIYIAVWLLRDALIPPEAVEQTYLLRFFCTTSPLSLFL